MPTPYDTLPYRSAPIEWTAPERLSLASRLHGGPRTRLDAYRVLELGCGNGANLLPMAWYRPQAEFVGIDYAQSQISLAQHRARALGLEHIEFIHGEFTTILEHPAFSPDDEPFDYIIAHGVFSWIPEAARDAMLALVRRCLAPNGLFYVNYNARPGWNVRGLVRELLLTQTATESDLLTRARRAQEVAGTLASALDGVSHPYSQLLAHELQFAWQGDLTWIAHEFLSPDNHAYWRTEFLTLMQHYGLAYVADADFNYASGRIPQDLIPQLDLAQLVGRSLDETVDLLCYRQLHSAILTPMPFQPDPFSQDEFARLTVASCLELCENRVDEDTSIDE